MVDKDYKKTVISYIKTMGPWVEEERTLYFSICLLHSIHYDKKSSIFPHGFPFFQILLNIYILILSFL